MGCGGERSEVVPSRRAASAVVARIDAVQSRDRRPPVAVAGAFRSSPTTTQRNVSLRVTAPLRATGAVHLASPLDEAAWIDVRALDVAEAPAQVAEDALVHVDVAKDSDLVRAFSNGGFEEWRVLRHVDAPKSLRWEISAGPSITGVRVRDGYVEAYDAKGYVHVSGAPIWARDAHGASVATDTSITERDHRWVLRVDVRPERATHPVVVDPAWTAVASMPAARSAHEALLLPDKRVLVVGGNSGCCDGNTIDHVYDPTTNMWTATGARDQQAPPSSSMRRRWSSSVPRTVARAC